MESIGMIARYCKEFGFRMFLINGMTRVFHKAHFSKKLIGDYCNFKNRACSRFLYRQFQNCIISNHVTGMPEFDTAKRVYVFWEQGENNAPPLVKLCIASMRRQNNMDVVCLSKDNYDKFVDLPSYIVDKEKSGNMCMAHFSDVLCFALLYKYGGVWIDATCFQTGPIPQYVFDYSFYSLNGPFRGIKGLDWKWTSFYMAAKPGDIVCKKMLEFYYCYWKEHNYALTYLILDCWLTVLCEQCKEVRDEIDQLPRTDLRVFTLNQDINNLLDTNALTVLFKDTYLHKLTYKNEYYKKIDGIPTNWGYIAEHENSDARQLEN